MKTLVEHEVILASAGSGKTYQLTNRFIRLLAAGVPPNRVIALTFTRKAAGEFLDAIVDKLCRASLDERVAARLSGEIDAPSGSGCAFYRERLKEFLGSLARLQLGTIDSFLHRVVGSFSLDLGLSGNFSLMDDFEQGEVQVDLLRDVLSRYAMRSAEADEFAEAFRESTYGNEEKSITRLLGEFVDCWHELYLEAPDGAIWGNIRDLLPGPPPSDTELDTTLTALESAIEASDWTESARKMWTEAVEYVRSYQPIGGAKPKTLLSRAGGIWAAHGSVDSLQLGRSKERILSPLERNALDLIFRHLVAKSLDVHARRTRGIHRIMDIYERLYGSRIRRRGRLTFADLPMVLGDARLSADLGDEDEAAALRLFIDYRLDARFDHWMIDEFQDTSRVQWRVFSNLIDEVVQDNSGTRSFFYVGDVKQSIYSWRGGDPRLFDEIRHHYGDERIRTRPLHDSFRSVEGVLGMVNRVFSNTPYITEAHGPKVAQAWSRVWAQHRSRVSGEGFSGVLFSDKESEESNRDRFVLRLLQALRPHERGLSCAVLVRGNKRARAIVDYVRLQSGGTIPISGEQDVPVATDNPVGVALVSWLRAVVHPGDTFASGHLQMTPLAGLCAESGWRRTFLSDLAESGFESALSRFFTTAEEAVSGDDGFSRLRISQLREAARLFDARGSRSIDAFVRYLESHTLREGGNEAAVQVMTIHKSKGLGFDIVIMADLDRGQGLGRGRAMDSGVGRDEAGNPQWILDLPDQFIRMLCPALEQAAEEVRVQQIFEELCNLYVGMTRAKRGLYLILDPLDDGSRIHDHRRMVQESMGGVDEVVWEHPEGSFSFTAGFGRPDWVDTLPEPQRNVAAPRQWTLLAEDEKERAVLTPELPSDHEGEESASHHAFFSLGRQRAASLGTTVHEIFAAIGSVEEDPSSQVERARSACHPVDDGLWTEAASMVLACLHDPGTRVVFEATPSVEIWCERAFDVIVDGRWTSGVIDRVELLRGNDGRFVSAVITDFKTDVVDDPLVKQDKIRLYASQLSSYRASLARITGLLPDAIDCRLLFVRDRTLVEAGG